MAEMWLVFLEFVIRIPYVYETAAMFTMSYLFFRLLIYKRRAHLIKFFAIHMFPTIGLSHTSRKRKKEVCVREEI